MKLWIIGVLLLVLVGLTVPFVSAEQKSVTIGKIKMAFETKHASRDIVVEPTEYSSDPVKAAQQRIGLLPKEKPGFAIHKGTKLLGTVPEGSKFLDIEIHEDCLQWQYGTDNWYVCEKRIADDEAWIRNFPEEAIRSGDAKEI